MRMISGFVLLVIVLGMRRSFRCGLAMHRQDPAVVTRLWAWVQGGMQKMERSQLVPLLSSKCHQGCLRLHNPLRRVRCSFQRTKVGACLRVQEPAAALGAAWLRFLLGPLPQSVPAEVIMYQFARTGLRPLFGPSLICCWPAASWQKIR